MKGACGERTGVIRVLLPSYHNPKLSPSKMIKNSKTRSIDQTTDQPTDRRIDGPLPPIPWSSTYPQTSYPNTTLLGRCASPMRAMKPTNTIFRPRTIASMLPESALARASAWNPTSPQCFRRLFSQARRRSTHDPPHLSFPRPTDPPTELRTQALAHPPTHLLTHHQRTHPPINPPTRHSTHGTDHDLDNL